MKLSVKTIITVQLALSKIRTDIQDAVTKNVILITKKSKQLAEDIKDEFSDIESTGAVKDKDGVFQYDYNPITGEQTYKQDEKKSKAKKEAAKKYVEETFMEFPTRIVQEELSEDRMKNIPYFIRESLYGIIFDHRHFTKLELEIIAEDDVLLARLPLPVVEKTPKREAIEKGKAEQPTEA